MRFRRIVAAAAAAAAALMPVAGHAVGENARTISGTACTVGDATLVYNAVDGEWIATADLACRNSTGEPANQTSLALEFTVTHVQYVNPFPAPTYCCTTVMTAPMIGCLDCASIQAASSRVSLAPGIYALNARAQLVQPKGGYKSGSHTTCFLVTGNDEGAATSLLPGCSL